MTLVDIYVLLLPVIGTLFVLAVGQYGSRQLRKEVAREAASKRQK